MPDRRPCGGVAADLAGGNRSGVGDAAHLQALQPLRFKALADDEFGAAAADIDHQPRFDVIGEGVGHAQVDQARFLPAVDHIHPGTEDTAGRHGEFAAVVGDPGRGCPTRTRSGSAAQQLGKAARTTQAALDGFLGEAVALQAGAQLDFPPAPPPAASRRARFWR